MSKRLQKKLLRQCVEANIRVVTVLPHKPITKVTIRVDDQSGVDGSFFTPAREFRGVSRCNPLDMWDSIRGYEIAYHRAVAKAVKHMLENMPRAASEFELEVDDLIFGAKNQPIGVYMGDNTILVRGTVNLPINYHYSQVFP